MCIRIACAHTCRNQMYAGTNKDFIIKVKNIKAVKEVQLVIGICDAITKIEAESIGAGENLL